MADERRFQQSRENFRRRLREELARERRTIFLPYVHTPLPTTHRLLRSIVIPNNAVITSDNPTINANIEEINQQPNCSVSHITPINNNNPNNMSRHTIWTMPTVAIVSPVQPTSSRVSLSSRSSITDGEERYNNLPIPELSSDSSLIGENLTEDTRIEERIPYTPIVEDISNESDETYRIIQQQLEEVEHVVETQHQSALPVNPPWFVEVDSEGEPVNNEPFNLPLSQQYDPYEENSLESASSSLHSLPPLTQFILSSASTTPTYGSEIPPPEDNQNPPKRLFMSTDTVERQRNVFGNLTMVEGVVRYRYFVKRLPQEALSDQPNNPRPARETSPAPTDDSPRRKRSAQLNESEERPITPTIPEFLSEMSSKCSSSTGIIYERSETSDTRMCPPTPTIPHYLRGGFNESLSIRDGRVSVRSTVKSFESMSITEKQSTDDNLKESSTPNISTSSKTLSTTTTSSSSSSTTSTLSSIEIRIPTPDVILVEEPASVTPTNIENDINTEEDTERIQLIERWIEDQNQVRQQADEPISSENNHISSSQINMWDGFNIIAEGISPNAINELMPRVSRLLTTTRRINMIFTLLDNSVYRVSFRRPNRIIIKAITRREEDV